MPWIDQTITVVVILGSVLHTRSSEILLVALVLIFVGAWLSDHPRPWRRAPK